MRPFKRFIGFIILFWAAGCQIFDAGENRLVKEYYNPKSNMKVIVFEKYGNATVNNSIQASIHEYGYQLKNNDVGNIFVADRIEGKKQNADSLLTVKWLNNETVLLIYPKDIRVFTANKQFKAHTGTIRIEYRTNQ